MSSPTSFRLPVSLDGKAEPEVVEQIQYHDDAITDLQQAIPSLKSQIDALKPTSTSSTTTENITNNTETTIINSSNIGMVNDQTGNTVYATQQSDYGAFILLNDASPIAVELTQGTSITIPWFTWIINLGTGTATLTPDTGLIDGASSLALIGGQGVTVVYDGANFEILPLLTIANVAGLAAALALLSPLASPTFTGAVTQPAPSVVTAATTATSATAGAASALPATPAIYLEISVNGTIYKFPGFSV